MSRLRTAFFALFCMLSGPILAQGDSAFVKEMVSDVCAGLTEKKHSITAANFETQVGLILMPVIVKYNDQIKKAWGFDYTVGEESESIGKKVGSMLVVSCPTFNELIMKYAVGQEVDEKSISGTLLQIASQQFTYLRIKNKNGKEEKIWWLEYFEGSDKLHAGTSILNKPITINYKVVELYDITNKEYKSYKVATGIK